MASESVDRETVRNLMIQDTEQAMQNQLLWDAMSADQQKFMRVSLQVAQQKSNPIVNAFLDYFCSLWPWTP